MFDETDAMRIDALDVEDVVECQHGSPWLLGQQPVGAPTGERGAEDDDRHLETRDDHGEHDHEHAERDQRPAGRPHGVLTGPLSANPTNAATAVPTPSIGFDPEATSLLYASLALFSRLRPLLVATA